MRPVCCAVLVAAGSSLRMSAPKQLLPLLGIPVLARTLLAFEKSGLTDRLVVVCRPGDRDEIGTFPQRFGLRKPLLLVPGGETRQRSVALGVRAAGEPDYFAIHDGARPLVTPEEIDRAVADAWRWGASALAAPVKDTIKTADENGFVTSTPERSALWAVQTPQVFARELYLAALEKAEREGGDYTDDCQLAERWGARVHLCAGSYENLKLTTPEDLLLAEAILRKRGESSENRTRL